MREKEEKSLEILHQVCGGRPEYKYEKICKKYKMTAGYQYFKARSNTMNLSYQKSTQEMRKQT